MSVDLATVRRVAHLARIALDEAEARRMLNELNATIDFARQLDEVDVAGVEPMVSVVSVTPAALPLREDAVTDGGKAADVMANAPMSEEGFFLVPKVVE